MDLVSDLQTYQSLLGDEASWQTLMDCIPTDGVFLQELRRFCSLRFVGALPCKIAAIKRLFRCGTREEILPPVKLKFHLFKAGHTYMLDRGEVHFCRLFLFRDAFEKNVAMTLHELAHVYLLGQADYSKLLVLDGEFLERLKTPSQTVIAPVEFYANLIANRWLSAAIETLPASKRREALKKEIALVEEKLRVAIQQL